MYHDGLPSQDLQLNQPTLPHQPDSFPTEQTSFTLDGPKGRIEVLVDRPDPENAWNAVALLCPPQEEPGGMHNKVQQIIERACQEMGLVTVRLNYRDASDEEPLTHDGYAETDDVLAVAAWVREKLPDFELWLGGYSFGAFIAARASQTLPVRHLVTVAPPVDKLDFAHLERPDCPWLVIQGDTDDVVSADAVRDWVESMEDPPQLIWMDDADHEFHRRLMDLRGVIKNGVKRARQDQAD